MSCKITYTPDFAKALKHLAKKYKSMKTDYAQLLNDLRANPFLGTDLGRHLRKVRMSITSKGKGKSGGARVITYTVILAKQILKSSSLPSTISLNVRTLPIRNWLI